MNVRLCANKRALGTAAAQAGLGALRAAIHEKGAASIVLATGVSQFELLEALVAAPDVDWARVTAFHLDEYIGITDLHPGSLRGFLRDRFTSKLPELGGFVPIDGDSQTVEVEIARLNALVVAHDIDVCFVGIGENCHLALNDPPADFATDAPYLIVTLDEASRRQQLSEGWFPTLATVPDQAITMSIRQIMKARKIVMTAADTRKAQAVSAGLEGAVLPAFPASVLQQHADCDVFLDAAAAALLARVPEPA